MPASWTTFLRTAGAVVTGGIAQHFGDPDGELKVATTGTILADLSSLSLIRAHGNNVAEFLQGQLTNDIQGVDLDRSQLSAHCNSKGRMLAVLRVFLRDQTFVLQLPASMRESLMERLRLYILRSDVSLESVDEELRHIGIAGPEAEAILLQELGRAPAENDACSDSDGVTLIRVRGPQPRFELIAPLDVSRELWRRLHGRAQAVGTPVWAWLNIHAGIPNIFPETSEAFVPQMANLELVGGVSFSKGCYVGQEIVARMQFLGKLKQRMYRMHVITDTAPKRGEAVYASDLRGQSSGAVVDAHPAPEGGYDLLAVTHISSVESAELYLGGERGSRLTVQPLPYSLTPTQ